MAEQATVSATHVAAIPLDCITSHPGNRRVAAVRARLWPLG